jgi:RimJ/RimL family protein N-acetyltransferase
MPAMAKDGKGDTMVHVPGSAMSLRTDRLALTRPEPGDAAGILTIVSDPQAVHHNPSDALHTLPEVEQLVARWIDHWNRYGFGYWCVREINRDQVVGYCGLKVVSFRDDKWLNLIYRFSPAMWGSGIGSEAASAVVGWSDTNQPDHHILARIRPLNAASQRVALKAGLRRVPTMDEEGQDGLDLLFMR